MAVGLAGSQFPGEDAQGRRIKDLERDVQQLRAANQLASAGIRAVEGGIVVEGSETVNGPLEVNGESEFNGSLSINGPLNLQPGSIQNDSLANPTQAIAAHAEASNFALPTGSNVEIARITVAVPAGFTKAAIYATAIMNARNNTAALDSAYLTCTINGAGNGWSAQVDAEAGNVVHLTKTITGVLSSVGSTVYITAAASSGTAEWPANNARACNLDAMITFYR